MVTIKSIAQNKIVSTETTTQTLTPSAEPLNDTPMAPTPTPTAVTAAITPCYAGNNEVTITISPYVIVEILEKNSDGNWIRVRVNEVIVCWVALSSLRFDINDLDTVPIVTIPTPQTPILTIVPISPFSEDVTTTPPLLIRWKIESYDCANGRATGATIGLDVSGGIPDYSYSPELPIYANPEQYLSIAVYSDTAEGEPSGTINFMVPKASDTTVFKCDRPGNKPAPDPLPTEPPPHTDPPYPEDPPPPVCYNPQGKVIPCKNK
jgi:hypothetical protein